METKEVDLRDLRAFCRVVDLGSVTAAAAVLGETKGSVSRRLARLEAKLGVPLLSRTARRVRPTEEGQRYRERVGRAVALVDEAGAELSGQRSEPSGVVRITAPPDLGVSLLAPLMGELAERHPLVHLDLLLTDAVLPFAENALDLALRAAITLPDSSLIAHRLGGMRMLFAASPAYLAAHGAPTHPDELTRHRLLAYRRTRGLELVLHGPDGARAEITLTPQILASDGGFLREAAIAGGGIAGIPLVFAREALADGHLVPVLPAWEAEFGARIHLLHAGGQTLSAGVRAVRDLIRERGPALLVGS